MAERARNERMVGVFGNRELELAAIRILDEYWRTPTKSVDPTIFKDEWERDGWRMLVDYGWIDVETGIPTARFWSRVHGRQRWVETYASRLRYRSRTTRSNGSFSSNYENTATAIGCRTAD